MGYRYLILYHIQFDDGDDEEFTADEMNAGVREAEQWLLQRQQRRGDGDDAQEEEEQQQQEQTKVMDQHDRRRRVRRTAGAVESKQQCAPSPQNRARTKPRRTVNQAVTKHGTCRGAR